MNLQIVGGKTSGGKGAPARTFQNDKTPMKSRPETAL
jgi:hypothetical protein